MSKMLLAGIAAAFIAFNAIPVQAAVSDEILLGRLSGTAELAQTGVALVNFVQGRPLASTKIDHVAAASLTLGDEQVARYYDDSVLLTLAMLVIVALAFVGVAAANRGARDRAENRAPGRETWRSELMRMLESDLTNFDGLKPGASR